MSFLFESGITISNSSDSAIKDSKWSNPGSELFNKIMESPNWKALLKEAYLICDIDKIKKGETSYSNSGCKYPHHKIVGSELVVSESGIKAAYSRAKQMGIFSGEVKNHIIKHYRELGLLKDSNINECSSFDKIIQNFNDIEVWLEASKAKRLKKLYPIFILSRHVESDKIKNIKDDKIKNQVERSNNFSKILNAVTGGQYTHCGISLNENLKDIYSFNTINQDQDSGYSIEHINDVNWSACTIYVTVSFVQKESIDKIKAFLKDLKSNAKQSEYQFSQLIKTLINQKSGFDYKFICSSFVGYILYLADARNLNRNFNLIKPDDVTVLPKTFYIMNIDSDEWNRKGSNEMNDFKARVKNIYDKNIEELNEYNNHVPKIMIQNEIKKTSSFDNFINELINKFYYKRG